LAEIGFYHLFSASLDRALPKLLERACSQGYRIVVRAASPDRVEYLNSALWTHREENPNGASMLVLVDGLEAGDLQSFARCADFFDGNDAAAVEAARDRWRRAREAGHQLTYWQQTASGWERKA